MRFLASSQKLDEFPDVPTLAELGYDFEVFDSYRGVWTSKDVPDEAVDYYIDVLEQVFATDEFQDFIVKNSMQKNWIAGDDLDKRLDAEVAAFKDIAEKMNLIEN